MARYYIIADPALKKFLNTGTGNSEDDGDMLMDQLHEATIFNSLSHARDQYSVKKTVRGKAVRTRHPADYWYSTPRARGEVALGKFMQTCEAYEINLTLSRNES